MQKINFERIPDFYHNYIKNVAADNISAAFGNHLNDLVNLLQGIDEDKWDYRYASDKWSIKELVQHIIDTERIFNYRALCIARKDSTPLPGFDEKWYAANSKADKRTKADLIKELKLVQQSTVALFGSFDEQQLQCEGNANGRSIYVEAIGYIIIGHALHHKKVLEERYL